MVKTRYGTFGIDQIEEEKVMGEGDNSALSPGLKRSVGSPRIDIDLDALTSFASPLMVADITIAKNLGISVSTLRRRIADTPAVAEAYERGRAISSERLSEVYEKKINPDNDAKDIDNLLTIIASKQPESRGGLGMMDERSVKHGGKIEIVIRDVVGTDDAIDITPERVMMPWPEDN